MIFTFRPICNTIRVKIEHFLTFYKNLNDLYDSLKTYIGIGQFDKYLNCVNENAVQFGEGIVINFCKKF